MRKTKSTKPLARFVYYPQDDGTAIVLLRDNIEQVTEENEDGTEYEAWQADETEPIVTDLGAHEIEDHFDSLWYRATRDGMTDAEWREDIESQILDLMEVVA